MIDLLVVQPHLLSIAENINEAEFNPKEYERIDAVISKEGERIQVSVTFDLWRWVSDTRAVVLVIRALVFLFLGLKFKKKMKLE